MKIIFLASVLLLSQLAVGQVNEKSVKAFSESYKHEYSKKYKTAIDDILSLKSDTYQVNLRLGWLYYLNGDYNKSKIYYKKAINSENQSIEARFGLVYPLSAMKNLDEVIQIYKEILSINPKETVVNYKLAYIYFYRKQYEKAIPYLKQNLKLYPFDYSSNILLGSIYIKMGKINKAKMFIVKALEISPQSQEALNLYKIL